MSEGQRPKVSVAMLTYNHKSYIVQALDSVLMQEIDFEYEIVLGDDASDDGTREILLKYAEKYPHRFHLLLHENNLGVGRNAFEVLSRCSGDYIAFLEGDDYWTSPYKLSKQVEFLDTHPDFSLCFHPVTSYSEGEKKNTGTIGYGPHGKTVGTLQDLLEDQFVPRTCSVVYRRLFEPPFWITNLTNVDMAIFILSAHDGFLGCLDQIMATYRIHNEGVWSGADNLIRSVRLISTFEALNSHYQYRYADYFKLRQRYANLAQGYRQIGKPDEAKRYFRKCVFDPHGGKITITRILKTGIKVYLPFLYSIYEVRRKTNYRITTA